MTTQLDRRAMKAARRAKNRADWRLPNRGRPAKDSPGAVMLISLEDIPLLAEDCTPPTHFSVQSCKSWKKQKG